MYVYLPSVVTCLAGTYIFHCHGSNTSLTQSKQIGSLPVVVCVVVFVVCVVVSEREIKKHRVECHNKS